MKKSAFDREALKEYYGKRLQGNSDLHTKACRCNDEQLPLNMQKALTEINTEILQRSYGCGSPLPPLLDGCTVLDLGCGAGRDAYLASRFAGPDGFVIGIDMTDEQLQVARNNLSSQMKRFGYKKTNIDFRQGYIEDLKSSQIADDSIDVVISNCVLNLSPDKHAVFAEIFRVLKPGGELYFSDVFAGRRVPAELFTNPILHGECLAGAMYIEDFRRLLLHLGWRDYRSTSCRRIDLGNPEIEAIIGMVDLYSITVRVFKLDTLEDICEDYGQTVTYNGTIPDWPHFFILDDHHRFITDKPMLVCGNTAAMLQETRYGRHFTIRGDRSIHFGPFACGSASLKESEETGTGGACC